MTSDKQETQVTSSQYDYSRKPPQERAVGLYRVKAAERTMHFWAESSWEAEKMGIVEGLTEIEVEPVNLGDPDAPTKDLNGST